MSHSSQPYLTERGLWAISIGFTLSSGKRVQKKHWLGRDRKIAFRIASALRLAWERETTTDQNGQIVWSRANIDEAYAFAGAPRNASTTIAAPVPISIEARRSAVPVFQPELPPPAPPDSYTFDEALDEFDKWHSSRQDIGEAHRRAVSDTIKSIKARLPEIVRVVAGRTLRLNDQSMSAVDGEWLDAIRNFVTSRPISKVTDNPIALDTVHHWLRSFGDAFT